MCPLGPQKQVDKVSEHRAVSFHIHTLPSTDKFYKSGPSRWNLEGMIVSFQSQIDVFTQTLTPLTRFLLALSQVISGSISCIILW